MPRRGNTALAVLLTSLTFGTCVFPTERDDAVQVSIDPLPVLVRGTDTFATAHAWHGSQELVNVTFVWSSDDPLTATVDATGHVVGIKSGTTTIRARAANFDRRSVAGQIALRVANSLEIDSIRPDSVKYGEIVDIYGIGLLDTLGVGLSVGDGGLIHRPFSDTTYANGASRVRYWVPPPAHTAPMFYIGAGVFGFTADTVYVQRRDLYEPNEFSPETIDLDTSRPFPGTLLNFVLFANPALAFELLPRDVPQGADWYRLRQPATRDLSIILSSDVPGTFQTFLTDSLGFRASDTSYFIGSDAWTFGPQSHSCHGAAFAPKEAPSDSTVVALKDFPAGSLDAITIYTQPGRYALTVVEGYVVAGKGITADSHEEDDYCNAADAKLPPDPFPFQSANLTIDNAHDVDWFLFDFPGGAFQARTTAPTSAAADPSDIDLYLLLVPKVGDPQMTFMATSTRPGSDEDIQPLLGLPAGQYYLVVTDFAGVPTRYSLCFGVGSCVPPPVSPAPSAAELKASITRRARLEAAIKQRPPAPLR